jgi:hypothetical protein
MRLFDIGEKVVESWPVSADIRRRRLYLELGRDKDERDTTLFLRFGSSLSNLIFQDPEIPQDEWKEILKGLTLAKGSLMTDNFGMCLTRERYPDKEALVRTGIAPGIGGRVWYVFEQGAHVLAEGVFLGEEMEYPIYLLRLSKDARVEVHRNGETDDQEGVVLPTKKIITWNGEELSVD